MAAVDYATGRFRMADFPFDHSSPLFDLSDYILLDEGPVQCPLPVSSSTGIINPREPQGVRFPQPVAADVARGSSTAAGGQFSMTNQFASSTSSTAAAAAAAAAGQFSMNSQPAGSSSSRSNSVEGGGGGGLRVAFRTKTEVDVLDDGFKWRKYGKKSVKNSPNPRNYYRCSTEGCSVKKRVERDRDNPSYVITTYDGVHNHTSADVVYYATQDTASGQFVVSGRYSNMPPNSST